MFTDLDRVISKLRVSGNGPRRAVASAMCRAFAAEKHAAFVLMQVCSIGAHDVPWLMAEFSQTSANDVRLVIAEVISRRMDPHDVDNFDAVLIAASTNDDLRAAIEPLVVYLGTPLVEQMKAAYEQHMSHQRPEVVIAPVPTAQSLSEILADIFPETFFRVYWLLSHQRDDPSIPDDPLPGWSKLGDDIKTRIL